MIAACFLYCDAPEMHIRARSRDSVVERWAIVREK